MRVITVLSVATPSSESPVDIHVVHVGTDSAQLRWSTTPGQDIDKLMVSKTITNCSVLFNFATECDTYSGVNIII